MQERSVNKRLDDLHESITEQMMILKAIATSQALAVEQQGQIFIAQMNADTMLRKVNLNVITVLKTTDSILGISKRTEALVRAARARDYYAVLGLLLDPWFCLYAYILLHPVAPVILENAASVWQFVLFAYRLSSFLKDGQSSLAMIGISGITFLYFTSPYKALYYLYWLNRAFVYGEIQNTRALIWTVELPNIECTDDMNSKTLVCLADFTVNSLYIVLNSLKTALMNSDVALQVWTLIQLEWAIWHSIFYAIYRLCISSLYSILPSRLKYFF
jgi:hypothetical protein